MELAVKCAALAIFSALVSLMIRRRNPELSFALAAATVLTLLLASASMLEKTIASFREAETIFADASIQMKPMLKCLGICAGTLPRRRWPPRWSSRGRCVPSRSRRL